MTIQVDASQISLGMELLLNHKPVAFASKALTDAEYHYANIERNIIRAIKEAIYIRVNNPSFSRNTGKYHLPHIWDEVLINIPELKLK